MPEDTILHIPLPITYDPLGKVSVEKENNKIRVSFVGISGEENTFTTTSFYIPLTEKEPEKIQRKIYRYIKHIIEMGFQLGIPAQEIQAEILEGVRTADYLEPLKNYKAGYYFPMLGTVLISISEENPEVALLDYRPAFSNIKTEEDRSNRFLRSFLYLRETGNLSLTEVIDRVINKLKQEVELGKKGSSVQLNISEYVSRGKYIDEATSES